MVEAVIFDMNGVIIVDEQYHNESWVELCRRYSFSITDEEFKTEVMGKRDRDTLDFLFKRILSDEECNKYADERDGIVEGIVKDKLQLPEGLLELLSYIKEKNLPLAIATSSRRGYVDFIMETFNLRRYFPVIVTAEDVVNGKPDPEMYLKTAKKLNVTPANCLVFEDSHSGVKAAKGAGMFVVAITSSNSREDLEESTDVVIDSFIEFDKTLLS